MKVKILYAVCIAKGVDAEPGKTYDVPDHVGKDLIRRGKAVSLPAKQEASTIIEDMKAGQLVEYAGANNLDIGGLQPQAGKEKILAAVKEALAKKKAAEEGQ